MHYLIQPAAIHDADVTVPGDKSVSHRAIMLGSIAQGVTEVRGFLAGEDCLATGCSHRKSNSTWVTQGRPCASWPACSQDRNLPQH
jgi:5-enolpyruvylshikimate-3-phosphate synthase